jgi:lipopolysaccharide/colanic/teichoic acid biosynthesis glycosyltransferase
LQLNRKLYIKMATKRIILLTISLVILVITAFRVSLINIEIKESEENDRPIRYMDKETYNELAKD